MIMAGYMHILILLVVFDFFIAFIVRSLMSQSRDLD